MLSSISYAALIALTQPRIHVNSNSATLRRSPNILPSALVKEIVRLAELGNKSDYTGPTQ